VDGNVHDKYDTILLHSALHQGSPEMVARLLDQCVKVNAKNHWGETALHVISRSRHNSQGVHAALVLLERGADVDSQRKNNWTPLHVASYYGNLELIRLLLGYGAKADTECDNGENPLHKVSYGKYKHPEDGVSVAGLLLKHGVDVNTRNKNHLTPLHVASYVGNIEIVLLLLDHGADPESNAEGHIGEKPLHQVSYGKYRSPEDGVRVAQLLLERGADVNTRRKDDQTPLHVASYFGNVEMVLLLLDHGADPEAAWGDQEAKPLHRVSLGEYRSLEGGLRVAQLLLDHGTDVNARRKDNQTPLHLASYFGNVEIARLLLDRGADLEAEWGDLEAKPLHRVSLGEYKSQEGGIRVAQLLLDRGADVNTRRNDQQTPLHLASYFGNVEIVRLLLNHGADLEAAWGDMAEKPLHRASLGEYRYEEGGVRVAQLLLDHGAYVNTRRKDNQTPLHLASYFGNVKIVRLLLNHGADLEAAWGDMAEKPLHRVSLGEYRSQEGGVRVAQLLLDHGAYVNTRRKDNQTPLHLASYFGNVEIVRLLLDRRADLEAAWGDMEEKPLHRVSFGEYRSQEGGIRVAQLLLDRGADVNARRKDQQTPLHLASYLGNVEIVRLLLDRGADLEAAWGDLEAKPLHRVSFGEYRSEEGGIRVAQLLLDHGADVNVRRNDNQTPLHLASYFGNVEIARLLLDRGADLEAAWGDLEAKPLHQVSLGEYRSQEGGVRVAQLLLDRGADVNARLKDRQTPLHLASYFGNVEIVRLLLDRGADLEATWGDMEAKPLHRVSLGEYRSEESGVRVAQLLLDHGADVDTRRNDNQTPLHLASYFGNVEIVRLLLDRGADLEAEWGALKGKPLHRVSLGEYRSEEGGIRVAQLLLDHGADVNTRRNDNQTPLHLASYLGNVEIVRLLLDRGADLEAAWGALEAKPLHRVSLGEYRSDEGGIRVAQLLLDHGADVNTRRNDNQTPLHLASYFGNLKIVRLLLDRGAEANAVDKLGKTPLHEVSNGKYKSQEDVVCIAQLLLDHGADVNARTESGKTPLGLASHSKWSKLAKLLERVANVHAEGSSASPSQAGA
jgi:ankyrin repeat protein